MCPPPGSPDRAPIERDALFPWLSFIYLSESLVNTSPSPACSPMGPVWRETPVSRAFFYTSPDKKNLTFLSKYPVKDPPLPCPPPVDGVPVEGDAPSPEPMVYSFIYICQSTQLRSSPTNFV